MWSHEARPSVPQRSARPSQERALKEAQATMRDPSLHLQTALEHLLSLKYTT